MKSIFTYASWKAITTLIPSIYLVPVSALGLEAKTKALKLVTPIVESISIRLNSRRTSWLCLLLLTAFWAKPTEQAWSQTISTVAGNGTSGYGGDGGQAVDANLNIPVGVALDGAGNIYIADVRNYNIRKVTASTGIINNVAGNGFFGFSGDGGPASSATLSTFGVALDGAGNVYIPDISNNRIRKVTASTGIITTVAGNGTASFSGDGADATLASLNQPSGVAVDGAGNIYIADSQNNRIRKVTASTGIITTIVGNGTASFSGDGGPATLASLNQPRGVTLDEKGNIYVVDMSNQRIRKVTASTGFVSTVAGNGIFGFSGDGGQATLASLAGGSGVAIDGAGNLYIADSQNQRIRKITASTGIISTIAGNGSASYSGDGGPAVSAGLYIPYGVALDRAGNLYVANQGESRIRKVNLNIPPTVVTAIPSQTATVSQAFNYTLPANTFTDDQTPDALTLSVSGLPAGLAFTAPATISGTPTTATGSPISLTVTATDPGGLSTSTILTITLQPETIKTADLTPSLYLPQANFLSSGLDATRYLTMSLYEVGGKPTDGVIVLTLTAPLGYSLGFDPTLTSTTVTGGTTNPVSVNNGSWEVRSSNLLQLTLVSKASQRIESGGVSVIGLSLTRSGASTGTANLTVNVNDDATNRYDSNSANNIYVRILNAL